MFIFFTDSASDMNFCLILEEQDLPLLSVDSLKDFPIYRDLSVLHFDIRSTNINSPYPVSIP